MFCERLAESVGVDMLVWRPSVRLAGPVGVEDVGVQTECCVFGFS